MGRIQTNVGLITGVPIGETVNQLMLIESRPKENLESANKKIDAERTAITELSVLFLAAQYPIKNLLKDAVYTKRSATSSNPSALNVRVTGTPSVGTYVFTPIRTAQSEQWLSSGVRESTTPLGGGVLSFRYGPSIDRPLALDAIRGGQGFERGVIRITDRSGASAEIDLTTVQTLDDVIEAINRNMRINVLAEVVGDHIRLTDRTGMT
ncbi:MAG TPA: flagellar cap protein FliD N-terminal domain-containing protein, partial [Thermogutta sp.]|nr:flagellar cap protein FliD N-terminal domain-containing protein [Thermogutta sp.]